MTDLIKKLGLPSMNVLDVAIKLSTTDFGTKDEWDKINEVLHGLEADLGLHMTSAGTGFGQRDMQFIIPPEQDPLDIVKRTFQYLHDHGYTSDKISYVSTYAQPDYE
jgi:hypothetical protein